MIPSIPLHILEQFRPQFFIDIQPATTGAGPDNLPEIPPCPVPRLSECLACGTNVSAPLSNDNFLDFSAAASAWPAGAPENLELIAVSATAGARRDIVALAIAQGGSGVSDTLAQNATDRPMERFDLFPGERIGRAQRVDGGRPQRLVHINIAQAGDERLVQ